MRTLCSGPANISRRRRFTAPPARSTRARSIARRPQTVSRRNSNCYLQPLGGHYFTSYQSASVSASLAVKGLSAAVPGLHDVTWRR